MAASHQRPALLSAAIIAVLVMFPALGLLVALIDRPADPFTGAQIGLRSCSATADCLLLLRSVALSMAVSAGLAPAAGRPSKTFPCSTVVVAADPASAGHAELPGGRDLRSSLPRWLARRGPAFRTTGFVVAVVVLRDHAPLSQLIIGAALARSSPARKKPPAPWAPARVGSSGTSRYPVFGLRSGSLASSRSCTPSATLVLWPCSTSPS